MEDVKYGVFYFERYANASYPDTIDEIQVFKEFSNYDEFYEWVANQSTQPYGKKFTAIQYQPLAVEVKVEVSINTRK